jgi:hypothetical protein
MERAGFVPIYKMQVLANLARELQAQINFAVVDRMHGVEDEDMFRYGRSRIDWEHRLNPHRPPFKPQS